MKSVSAACSTGRLAVGEPLRPPECIDQRPRRDHVPDPQARKHHLRERSDVGHGSAGVEPLKRRQRRAAVPVFAAVVVLDQRRPAAARPGQPLQPAAERHRHADGKLVRRCRVHQPCIPADAVEHDAVVVDGQRPEASAVGGQYPPGTMVAGVFDACLVARLDEQTCAEVERLLRSVDDDHLVGRAVDGPD